jgi:hypothetical protein
LFSGGLDSALGLAHDLQDGDSIAISVHTNYRMRSVQQRVIRELTKDPARSCTHLQYRVSLHERDRENSQRTRGLLFLAAGIATAWGLGQDRLRAYENGVGAWRRPSAASRSGLKLRSCALPRPRLSARCQRLRRQPSLPRSPATRASRPGCPAISNAERAPRACCGASPCTRQGGQVPTPRPHTALGRRPRRTPSRPWPGS